MRDEKRKEHPHLINSKSASQTKSFRPSPLTVCQVDLPASVQPTQNPLFSAPRSLTHLLHTDPPHGGPDALRGPRGGAGHRQQRDSELGSDLWGGLEHQGGHGGLQAAGARLR